MLYRPGTGIAWILAKNSDGSYRPVYQSNSSGSCGGPSESGIGCFDLMSTADQVIAFDYDSSGKQDHLVLYRPGTGIIYIVGKNSSGAYVPVFSSVNGIGGYDLAWTEDRILAFDYDGSGKQDHLVIYRPGRGLIYILGKNSDGSFSPVYASPYTGNSIPWRGIGGYDLASSSDRITTLDYNGTGKQDHLVLYRPGQGLIYILGKNSDGSFSPVYQSPYTGNSIPWSGIGGYDLASASDQIFAFDDNGTGRQDFLVTYRPGNGILWILDNTSGNFSAAYQSPAIPHIYGLSLPSGPAQVGFLITGSGFGSSQGSSKVILNGTAMTVISWSATSITAQVPSGTANGPATVAVTANGYVSPGVSFTVTLPFGCSSN